MGNWIESLWMPFIEYEFMRNALFASVMLGIAAGPLGILLIQRRMSLIGDAMSHSLLPGAAIGFWVFGNQIWAMGLFGGFAALSTAIIAGMSSRMTGEKEDAGLVVFYLIAFALGVLLVSSQGGRIDLMHMLFGNVLGMSQEALQYLLYLSGIVIVSVILFWRPLVLESFDPLFMKSQGKLTWPWHGLLLILAVFILVCGFVALGSLLAVSILMIPAGTARLFADHIKMQVVLASICASLSCVIGLLISFYLDFASGPSIVLVSGLLYLVAHAVKLARDKGWRIKGQRN